MPLSPPTRLPAAEAAITAFLHGIQRRAWVFARAQCGDEALAEQAVVTAVEEFRRACADKPLAVWPRDFWTILLEQPLLLRGHSQLLPELSVGPRAAILLRLVAGLDMAHAAQVLGVGEAAYRAALAHALQQMQAAGNDRSRLDALRDHLQQEIKLAPAMKRVMPDRETRAADTYSEEQAAPSGFAADDDLALPQAPWRTGLKILFGLLVLALIVSFFWTPWHGLAPGESEALPPEAIDTPSLADASAVITHPDFALLAVPEDEVLARDLAFYSWFASGGQTDSVPASAVSTQPVASSASSTSAARGAP